MGVTSSKQQDAFIGNNAENNDQSKKIEEQPCILSCFQTFFCPPNEDSSSSPKRGGRRHHKIKSFGTPLPDTPENVRRLRDNDNNNNNNCAAADGNEFYYHDEDDNEEKKMGGSLGRNNHNHELRSSRYGGLEKEISGMFSYENNNNNGSGEVMEDENNADIHDGKVSCCWYSCTLFIMCTELCVCVYLYGYNSKKATSSLSFHFITSHTSMCDNYIIILYSLGR